MSKPRPESKIPTTKTNTNKKRESDLQGTSKKSDPSLFRKNEFTLIVFGALLLTLIIFFLFFRSSSSKTESVEKNDPRAAFAALEMRIENIEKTMTNQTVIVASDEGEAAKTLPELDPLQDRVSRLEAAFSVKFDSLIERMGTIEKSISLLNQAKIAAEPVKPKTIPAVKTAVKKEKTGSMFHTVQKGETLYSISKKYGTSVAGLRKLNNLSATAKIYPGNNILIR
jgi:LysM repeat protein